MLARQSIKRLGTVDNSSIETRRPATCSQDPEILPDTQAYCLKLDLSGPREKAARRRHMNFQQALLLVCFLFLYQAVNAAHQQNYYRSFWNPIYHGERLAYCSLNQHECGLPIANHYCRMMGYEKAERQIIDYNVGLTHFIESRSQCKGWTCNGFMLIRCVSKMKHQPLNGYYYRAKKYVFPRYENYRVAWCYKNNHGCGRRAAFSFCRRMGYMREQQYIKQEHVLATREIGDKKLCFGNTCDGFSSITCYR